MEEDKRKNIEEKPVNIYQGIARNLLLIGITIYLALSLFLLLGIFLETPYPLVVVASGSMRPTIDVGDILVITGVDYEKIIASPENGDVIVYKIWGYDVPIIHRAIAKTEDGIITKGDANKDSDPWSPITKEQILGKWTGIKIPYWTGLGYLALVLKDERYYPISYLLIVLLILLDVLFLVRDGILKSRGNSS